MNENLITRGARLLALALFLVPWYDVVNIMMNQGAQDHMADLEELREQFNKHYSAILSLADGTWTDNETGIVYKNKESWYNCVNSQRREAAEGLEEYRDYSSELQNLPGTKPCFSNGGQLSR